MNAMRFFRLAWAGLAALAAAPLTPVPEPATAALWIAGLALAAARGARRRH